MRKRWLWIGLGAVAALALGLALRPEGRSGVAVIGDRAPEILEAAGWRQALPVRTAALTVVAVEDFGRLRYIPDMEALCGARCADPVALVRIVDLSPAGSRKTVLVSLAAWPKGADGTTDLACLARALQAESATLRAPRDGPACAAALPSSRAWSLFGLGPL